MTNVSPPLPARRFRALAAILMALSLSACATASEPSASGVHGPMDAPDKMEKFNRKVFNLNMALDRQIMQPVARGYRKVLPQWTRDAVRNFLDNLHTPVVLANDMLQGKPKRASTTLGRFVINSALGPAGLSDPAQSHFHLPQHDEDFGQTLAVWGVRPGQYIMLPFFGPSNPRDLTGRIVDYAFDPSTYVQWGKLIWVPMTRTSFDIVDSRARTLDTFAEIERTSIDLYASVKSLYEQNRTSEIRDGKVNPSDLPDF